MSGMFDSKAITVPCPKCGKKSQETIGRLKQNPKLTCSGCGASIKIEADELSKGLGDVEKSIDKLRASFRKLGK